MASYIFGIAMMVAVVLVAVGQKWPRIWVALRFPDSSTWPIISATVEQGIVQTYLQRKPHNLRGRDYLLLSGER